MAAEKELAELNEQFTGLLPDAELDDNMQIHGGDDALDLDADDVDLDGSLGEGFDDEIGGDDFDAGDDFEE